MLHQDLLSSLVIGQRVRRGLGRWPAPDLGMRFGDWIERNEEEEDL